MKTYSTKKKIIIRKKVVKKKPSKKVIKRRKRLCDKCKRRFDPDELVIHHKKNKKYTIPKKETEGMCVIDFNKYYSDKRKRPAHDRRDNIMIVCLDCYEKISDKKGE